MGQNFKSFKIAKIKRDLECISDEKTATPYGKQIDLLCRLLTIETISYKNCLWAKRYIHNRMRPIYTDALTIVEIDKLEERFTSAAERRERRREKREAEKLAAQGIRRPRKNAANPAPIPPPPPSKGDDFLDFFTGAK